MSPSALDPPAGRDLRARRRRRPARPRGYARLADENPATGHTLELGRRLRDELRHITSGRPRTVAVRPGISLGIGLAYLAVLGGFRLDVDHDSLPYLGLYALSVVIGSVACTNALSIDAVRVRAALAGGTRLWHLILAKNLALFCRVGSGGLLLSLLLTWRTGNLDALVKACGLVVTMILPWLGVGNVASVVWPLRHQPLSRRRHDGTLRPALMLAEQPRVVRALRRELVDYRELPTPGPGPSAQAVTSFDKAGTSRSE